MKRWVRAVFAIALLLLPTALHAQAEKRIAPLIGNKDYKAGVGALTNPLNDIRIVGEALKVFGFEVLKPVENAQRSAMLIAILIDGPSIASCRNDLRMHQHVLQVAVRPEGANHQWRKVPPG